jgi:hypothetical protein
MRRFEGKAGDNRKRMHSVVKKKRLSGKTAFQMYSRSSRRTVLLLDHFHRLITLNQANEITSGAQAAKI